MPPVTDPKPIRIGVSSCLLGEHVRYDGGHKRDSWIVDTLGKHLSFVPVCPEVESGMPVPREAMRLEGDPESPRLMTRSSRVDKTDQMLSFCRRKVEELATERLCGFIFKKDSPSSGLYRVKVYQPGQGGVKQGSGLFARAFVTRFPLIPVEEEGRLNDPVLRENFIERVFACHRWRLFRECDPAPKDLVIFHSRHKLLLMAHSPTIYRQAGVLVAQAGSLPLPGLLDSYEKLFFQALALHATPRKHANVLQHMAGYFRRHLTSDERQELQEVIDSYRTGLVPLIVPLTLMKHHIRRVGEPYLSGQYYLDPHPSELMLRNRV